MSKMKPEEWRKLIHTCEYRAVGEEYVTCTHLAKRGHGCTPSFCPKTDDAQHCKHCAANAAELEALQKIAEEINEDGDTWLGKKVAGKLKETLAGLRVRT